MHPSKAKVYPLNKLMDCSETVDGKVFVNPSIVDTIDPRNHMFDVPERANRREQAPALNRMTHLQKELVL